MEEKELDDVTIIKQKAEEGDPSAQVNWAMLCLNGNNKRNKGLNKTPIEDRIKEATNWLKISSEQGYPEAQFILGCLFDVYQNNKHEAFKWWKKAAEQNDGRAIVLVAECLLNGSGVEKNIEEAIMWFKKTFPNTDVESIIEHYKN